MPLLPADLRIDARWLVPMTSRETLLEHHSLLVRDGRILDILPTPRAVERYMADAVLERASHLLMPGMVNADASATQESAGLLGAIAVMLKSGVTCFAARHFPPAEMALAAQEQGIRAVVGMPVCEFATPWAGGAAEYFSRALALRDEYRGHPLISTAFAPLEANRLKEATFAKLVTLADELDAGITLTLNESIVEVRECEMLHAVRPMRRLWNHGLLTPALNAIHMNVADGEDLELARRTGISVTLSPQGSLRSGNGLPPLQAICDSGLRLGVGSAGALKFDIFGETKLLALLMHSAQPDAACGGAWEALVAATCGGAAVLGLEKEIGTLQEGKWADLCCVDLSACHQVDGAPLEALVFGTNRDRVTDVWVAGRQLVSQRELTRLDWIATSAE